MRGSKCELHTRAVRGTACLVHFAFCAGLLASCAQKTLTLPTGRGTPLADARQVHADLTKACAGARTLTAELGLSGRAGTQRLSGRALVGFQSPDAMRLEGLAPIGQPAFILVSRGGNATLLLPRDDRVLRGASAEDILGALTGVSLAPADLQAILAGCVVRSADVTTGSQMGDWVILELEGGASMYLRRTREGLQLRAARRDNWQIEYPEWQSGFPRTVRLISSGTPAVDMTARISQLETNVDLDNAAFTVDVPRDALPITLEELREAGPLRGSASDTVKPSTPNLQLPTPKASRFDSCALGVGSWGLGVIASHRILDIRDIVTDR